MGYRAPDKNSAQHEGGIMHCFIQAMRDILPFVSLMKEIDFVLKLQGDAPTVLCSLFENR